MLGKIGAYWFLQQFFRRALLYLLLNARRFFLLILRFLFKEKDRLNAACLTMRKW